MRLMYLIAHILVLRELRRRQADEFGVEVLDIVRDTDCEFSVTGAAGARPWAMICVEATVAEAARGQRTLLQIHIHSRRKRSMHSAS